MQFATAATPIAVSVGDLNGDGKDDLVVADVNANQISLLLNATSPGSPLGFVPHVDLPTGLAPISIALSDVDGDGKLDVTVAERDSATASVFRNETRPGATVPRFAAPTISPTPPTPEGVALQDLNGDGKPDVVVADFTANAISVLMNMTLWGRPLAFSPQTELATGGVPFAIAAADLNGDGLVDLVATLDNTGTVGVFLNHTAPGARVPAFAARAEFGTGANPRSVALADVNDDGAVDLAIGNETSGTVSVLLNTMAPGASTPTFLAKQDFPAGSASDSVTFGDLNGDGLADIAVVDHSGSNAFILLNGTSPGSLVASFGGAGVQVGSNPEALAIADLNDDGLPDLAVANVNDNTVSVLLNETNPGSAGTSFATKVAFPTGVFPHSIAVGDFNGDGQRDIAVANFNASTSNGDVTVLLSNTSPGSLAAAFPFSASFATGPNPTFVVAADFDADGRVDLMSANSACNSSCSSPSASTVSVLRGTTTLGAIVPQFAPRVDVDVDIVPRAIAVADLNGDGILDVAIVNSSSRTISILLGE